MLKIELSSMSPSDEEICVRQIVEWWNAIRVCDEVDVTIWEVLDDLERQVTECLAESSRDVAEASSLTFKAMLIVAGVLDF